ncbi:MAG: benzoate-CoA ligase family protein [Burkholderiales bacterium]
MAAISQADHSITPPRIDIPREYNAAHDLIERNLLAGRAGKTVYIDDAGRYSYGELAERVNRCANALLGQGLRAEDRVLLCLLDTIDFPTVFLGCIKAGIVPVAANTLLTPSDYSFMLNDSRAKGLIVSAVLLPQFQTHLDSLPNIIVPGESSTGHAKLQDLMARASTSFAPAPTQADDMCFWAYSSGSTGVPKGVVHAHSSLIQTAELYAKPILGIREDDVVFSAAKLFFAYGLGNALTFPLAVGATAVLMAERPTPVSVAQRLKEHQPTIFNGVPTLFAAMLASPDLPKKSEVRLRIATSAGEALPAQIGRRFSEHFGIDLLDGIGSTEMLHVFLSNRPGDVRHGTTGLPVPGYELRLVDDEGKPVPRGETGELQIKGPTQAIFYWNNRERTQSTFLGPWTRSGDKYSQDAQGYYVYAGRSDDMLKVGGIYVSPMEVESALITHASVLEAAVIGSADAGQLVKPKAFVVLKPGVTPSPALAQELKQHVKDALAPYKYPRWIEFVSELPKTATGKIQRFKLRALEQRP